MENKIIFLVTLIFILIVIKIYNIKNKQNIKERFTNIDYMVITLGNMDRLKNISEQQNKNNINIQLINAVNGISLSQDDLIKNNTMDNKFKELTSKRNNEIGCYLSHLKIYKTILDSGIIDGVTVIFEDDFIINIDNITQSINTIISELNNIDFDIIYLGNTFGAIGVQFKHNIYYADKINKILGTFGYLINNKSAKKIYNLMNYIDMQVDEKINNLIKESKLNAFVIKPNIVNHNYELKSTILV